MISRTCILGVLALGACAQPEEPGVCEARPLGRLGILVAYRGVDAPLRDGDALAVFEPPQGGIATELDVTIEGAGFEVLETLQIDVFGERGQTLSTNTYVGSLLPFRCIREGVVEVGNIPVAFDDALTLEALDMKDAELVVTVVRTDGQTSDAGASVMLEAASY